MKRFVLPGLAALLWLSPAQAAPGHEPIERALLLQTGTAVIAGVLAGGYAFSAVERVGGSDGTLLVAAPLSFALASGLGIWLAGRWRGLDSSLPATIAASVVPAILLSFAQLAATRHTDGFVVSALVLSPALSLAGGLIAFEQSRPDASTNPGTIRRAVADERGSP